jgi:GNAT superfamily N-acetyltransferase
LALLIPLRTSGHTIREIDPASDAEIDLVAQRMRETLIEVEGEETGTSLYSMDWLKNRVRWHLDSSQCAGKIFLAVNAERQIVGHTIVRVEPKDDGRSEGLFATTFVEPESRRHAVASELLQCGENWMLEMGMREAVTWTSADNVKLINLYEKHGYAIVAQYTHDLTKTPMVKVAKPLND